MVNKLIIGLGHKTDSLQTRPGFLLIDDGPIADAFLKRYSRAKMFDPKRHSFNPLNGMNYQKAREFASIIFGAEGRDTLTVRNGKRALTRMLVNADRIDRLQGGKGNAEKQALATIDDMLLSPVLFDVFCKPTNFSFRGGRASIVAKINRAELGDYDANILAALFIQQFSGQIIIPDFGFYARNYHTSLIRGNRFIAGIHTLAELDKKMQQLCLLMERVGKRCTYKRRGGARRIPRTKTRHGRL